MDGNLVRDFEVDRFARNQDSVFVSVKSGKFSL